MKLGADPPHLALGIFRTNGWGSHRLASGGDGAALIPLQTLAALAHEGHTRYTFILTPTELVVARVSRSGHPQQYFVEYKSIDLRAGGNDQHQHQHQLTAKLAIWALVMMSLPSQDRLPRLRGEMRLLNFWWRKRFRHRVYFQHYLSGCIVHQLSPRARSRDHPDFF